MNTISLDVRADIRNGGDPFAKIMSAIARLKAGESLLLTAPFAPVPLFHVLAKKGFKHTARTIPGGDWEVLFEPETGSPAPEIANTPTKDCNGGIQPTRPDQIIHLDARGLEPPQPMISILEALSTLPTGAELHAQTDRRPLHLYAQLEERGFTGQTEKTNDGSFITHIRRS